MSPGKDLVLPFLPKMPVLQTTLRKVPAPLDPGWEDLSGAGGEVVRAPERRAFIKENS